MSETKRGTTNIAVDIAERIAARHGIRLSGLLGERHINAADNFRQLSSRLALSHSAC
jgi:hypothetical protein